MRHARVRAIVAQAIRSGELVRPSSCSGCGTTKGRLVGHHDDYRRPLAVRWLCYSCHMKHHYAAGDVSRNRPTRFPERLNLTTDKETKTKITRLADRWKCSISDVVRRLVREAA